MKFLIRRAYNENPKVEGTKEEKYMKFLWWKRELAETIGWFIEINSIEDLLKLAKDVNEKLIISFVNDDKEPEIPEIIIYDDYIE